MSGIQESLHRIMACERLQLGQRFYERFLTDTPSAGVFFKDTNMRMQVHILVNSLQLVAALTEHNYPAARSYLKVLGHRHFQRQIPPDLYAGFRDAMLASLQEFHVDSWTVELEQEWRDAFDAAIDAMLQGYAMEQGSY